MKSRPDLKVVEPIDTGEHYGIAVAKDRPDILKGDQRRRWRPSSPTARTRRSSRSTSPAFRSRRSSADREAGRTVRRARARISGAGSRFSGRKGGDRSMATTAPPQTAAEQPPDTRGPTAPLPATVFGLGVGSLCAALVGTALVQLWYAFTARPLTPECIAEGLTHYDPATADGDQGRRGRLPHRDRRSGPAPRRRSSPSPSSRGSRRSSSDSPSPAARTRSTSASTRSREPSWGSRASRSRRSCSGSARPRRSSSSCGTS